MSTTKEKMPKWKKITLAIVLTIVFLLVALFSTFAIVWRNEISTLSSMKLVRVRNDAHLDGDVYMMEVNGGFYLDDFVAQGGIKSDSELIDFVTSKITNGIVADENILGMVGRRTWKNDDNNGCTVHSVVYNLTDKTVLWVSNENYDDPTAVFKFGLKSKI